MPWALHKTSSPPPARAAKRDRPVTNMSGNHSIGLSPHTSTQIASTSSHSPIPPPRPCRIPLRPFQRPRDAQLLSHQPLPLPPDAFGRNLHRSPSRPLVNPKPTRYGLPKWNPYRSFPLLLRHRPPRPISLSHSPHRRNCQPPPSLPSRPPTPPSSPASSNSTSPPSPSRQRQKPPLPTSTSGSPAPTSPPTSPSTAPSPTTSARAPASTPSPPSSPPPKTSSSSAAPPPPSSAPSPNAQPNRATRGLKPRRLPHLQRSNPFVSQ